jgi:hypothetical protein
VERASRGRRPATGAPASRGRESRTRRSRGGRRAHRVRGVECASATDERACPSVSEDTTPAWKTAREQSRRIHVRGRMSRDDTTRPTRKRAVSELYYMRYSQYLFTPSPPFPRRFRASISPLRPRG